ncbi:MAG: efflux RND transporter periplasmic adaptor subunit, partial [Gammaproteobacteria bacterium]|nr:efflux RND transporter periplasmic adaptor subunit [Gammaproteobacteria bacterium]
VGNLVGQGAPTTLAVVQQLDPIYIYFTINELDLLKLRKIAEKAGVNSDTINQIPIEVSLQDETDFPHKGYLDFAATELDAATGTIEMRGILPNHDYALLPGLYVKVRVALAKPTPQLTIPDVALMNDQIGSYVYTVDKNHNVQQKRVITGSSHDEMTTILKGLKANDHVIVEGIQNVTPGLTVSETEKDVP